MTDLLKVSNENRKTKKLREIQELQLYLTNGRKIRSIDTLAGKACPAANTCRSEVIETENGNRIKDGKNTEFRCFAASIEAIFPAVYKAHKYNFDLLRKCNSVSDYISLLEASFPTNTGILRFHVSGDFFKLNYFVAALQFAKMHSDTRFYAYTKQLPFWIDYRNLIPDNFILTASYGGKYDHLIPKHNLRYSLIVENEMHAKRLNLPVDNDDSHAATNSGNFALIIHGVQSKGRKRLDAI